MSEHEHEWRPGMVYPSSPPVALMQQGAGPHPTTWHAEHEESRDPRDEIDREALRRCVLEFEATAARLRRLLEGF